MVRRMKYGGPANLARQRDRRNSPKQLQWDWHASRGLADEILAKTGRGQERLAEVISLVLLDIDDNGHLLRDIIAELAVDWAIGNEAKQSEFTVQKTDEDTEFAVSVQVTERDVSWMSDQAGARP